MPCLESIWKIYGIRLTFGQSDGKIMDDGDIWPDWIRDKTGGKEKCCGCSTVRNSGKDCDRNGQ